MKNIFKIRCAKCLNSGKIINNKIPPKCPVCGNPFNPYQDDDPTLIKTILSFFTRGSAERGYIEEDHTGFSKGDQLPFPEETLDFY